MTSYRFDVSCQRCGGEVVHVNATPASSVHAVAVCRCVACDRQWELYLSMRPHAGDPEAALRQRKARTEGRGGGPKRRHPHVSGALADRFLAEVGG